MLKLIFSMVGATFWFSSASFAQEPVAMNAVFKQFHLPPAEYRLAGTHPTFLYRTLFFAQGELVKDELRASTSLSLAPAFSKPLDAARYPEYCSVNFVYSPYEITHPFDGLVQFPEVIFDHIAHVELKQSTETSVIFGLAITNARSVFNQRRNFRVLPYQMNCFSTGRILADEAGDARAAFFEVLERNVAVKLISDATRSAL